MDSLVKIEGKPIEKLIEVISNGIGTLYRPRAIRKEADAKAYEIKVIEKAKSEANADSRLIEAENLDRINERLIAKETARQNNIDDVVEIAAREINDEPVVSDKPVNKDWATRFFNIVQDVSDDEMKNLWGKILAGEVKSPNSYSLRTLELLRNLSKDEADTFVRIAQIVLKEDDYFIFNNDGDLSKFGITYSDIAKLTEIGLIQAGTFVQCEYKSKPDKDMKSGIIYNDKIVIIINIKQGSKDVNIPISVLTRAGSELYKLISVKPNIEYIKELASSIKNETVSVEYANINYINDDHVNYDHQTIKL